MTESTVYRCYYDDGTILTADYCPLTNDNGSPLVTSELTIIENVTGQMGFHWLLLVLALVILATKERK